jgi:hypothetical protein
MRRFMAVQPSGPREDVEHHPVRDREARHQALGLAVAQLLEGLLVPVRVAPLGRLAGLPLAQLLRVTRGLLLRNLVLDDVLRRLHDDGALRVEALAAGAPRDLVEVAHRQDLGLVAVVLAELGEHHGAQRNVHAHAERVRAADDLEQPLAGQPLHHAPVLGQHARVVHAHAVVHEAPQLRAEGRVPAEAGELLLDGGLVLLREEVDAHQVLRVLGGSALREVHHVDGRLACLELGQQGLVQRPLGVLPVERHRSIHGLHQRHGRSRSARRWTPRSARSPPAWRS